MNNSVTYFLGAGSSANAIPISNKIPDGIISFIDDIKKSPINVNNQNDRESLIQSLQWLKSKVERYGSADEYVAHLFYEYKVTPENVKINKEAESEFKLNKLKNVLSCCFA